MEFNPTDAAQRRFRGYGGAKIPTPRDQEVARFVAGLVAGGPPAVECARRVLTGPGREVLLVYAWRMASLAVRRDDASVLVGATVAWVLSYLDAADWRDVLVLMPALDDSATRLGVDVGDLFRRVSQIVGEPGGAVLTGWLERPSEARSLAAFHVVADRDPDGFRYGFDETWRVLFKRPPPRGR